MYQIKSVNRALSILDLFSLDCPELSISEVTRKLNMDKVTVARAMHTLEQHNILVRSPNDRKYYLGGKILELAGIILSKLDLRRIAAPYLAELHAKTNETVHIFIRTGDERICLDKIESSHPIRLTMQVGVLYPLHAGAAGKILLSGLTDQEIGEVIERTGLPRFTPNTITTAEQLRKEIVKIRQQGFAVSHEEIIPSSHQISAPVKDYSGKLVATVGVSWPSPRSSPGRLQEFTNLVKTAAARISQELGLRSTSQVVKIRDPKDIDISGGM